MTEPTETDEARRLITEAFEANGEPQAEAEHVLSVVRRSAAAFTQGAPDVAGTLLVDHLNGTDDPDQAAFLVCVAAGTAAGHFLDGDQIQRAPGTGNDPVHGSLLALALGAVNCASAGDDESLSTILGTVWDTDRGDVHVLAAALVAMLAEVLLLISREDGDHDG